jgi:hypothetical protein
VTGGDLGERAATIAATPSRYARRLRDDGRAPLLPTLSQRLNVRDHSYLAVTVSTTSHSWWTEKRGPVRSARQFRSPRARPTNRANRVSWPAAVELSRSTNTGLDPRAGGRV